MIIGTKCIRGVIHNIVRVKDTQMVVDYIKSGINIATIVERFGGKLILPMKMVENTALPCVLVKSGAPMFDIVNTYPELKDDNDYNEFGAVYSNPESGLDVVIKNREEIEKNLKGVLENNTNTTTYEINQLEDSDLLIAIKQAINNKNIDINSYKDIIGASFSNDIRDLKKSNKISIGKAINLCKALGIKMELTLSNNRNSNFSNSNKMSTKVKIELEK